jgi:hypothetical protein
MPIANKGDTINIYLNYTLDGNPILEGDLDEIEFTMGSHRYTLTDGDIVWDDNAQLYMIKMPQEDTFDLKSTTRYQLRVRKDNDVGSTDVEESELGDVLSKVVI